MEKSPYKRLVEQAGNGVVGDRCAVIESVTVAADMHDHLGSQGDVEPQKQHH